ncbi:DUF4124 domain-containing protein [Variovorax sp. RHLX14]|uniref:DUF4124 domain-containing protein n=1 Tax=Variovorax sp. RHLX14 TaxID=1259731 RepID=UPI003F45C95F
MQIHPRRASAGLLLASVVACCALSGVPDASAQQVFRHVDRNGKLTFSDQPQATDVTVAPAPAGASGAIGSAGSAGSANGSASGATATLPFELRQVVQRFPVTLYTREDCAPCDTGRALLNSRGVPFSERQIRTPEDSEAFLRLSSQDALPLLSIGAQQLKGFSDVTWSQYLDAAGYPKSIQLPAGYRNPPAQPLVTNASAAAPATAPQATTSPLPPIPPASTGPTPGNPAGIKF